MKKVEKIQTTQDIFFIPQNLYLPDPALIFQ